MDTQKYRIELESKIKLLELDLKLYEGKLGRYIFKDYTIEQILKEIGTSGLVNKVESLQYSLENRIALERTKIEIETCKLLINNLQ